MRLHLREHFNIVVNGVVRDSGGEDQSKTHTHTVNEPLLQNITLQSKTFFK